MPVRKFEANGKTYHLGRKRSEPRGKLHLGDYATATLPPPPATTDWSTETSVAVMGDIFENDNLGDCVIADNARFVGLVTGMGGATPFVYTNAQTTADYSAIGGYVPGEESTDQGCDPEAALEYYQAHGYADGSKLACWYAIDGTNELLVKQAVWLGGPIAVALDLPDAWINPFPSSDGFIWDVAGNPDPNNGHEVNGYGYSAQGLLIDSWGMKGTMTWAAVAKYCTVKAGGNLYGRMDQEMINKATSLAPSGFNWNMLLADAKDMGGNPVIPPAPTPTPPPAPATPMLITIDPANHVIAVPDPSTWICISNAPTEHPKVDLGDLFQLFLQSLPTIIKDITIIAGGGTPPAQHAMTRGITREGAAGWLVILQAIAVAVYPILFPPTPPPAPATPPNF